MKSEVAATVFLLAGLASVFGTPHMLASQYCMTFRNRCTQDIAYCSYVGLQGRRDVVPVADGDEPQHCGRIILLPLRWPLFQWTP